MRVLAAPNALKGSLDAHAAARAITKGLRRADPHAEVEELPVADGGDGTRSVLCRASAGTTHELAVTGPLGRPVRGAFSLLDAKTAAIDVATASGLALLAAEERDPLRATSFGTGELVRAALEAGARRIILGLGGSATVDGGAGLLAALGVDLLDASGRPIPPGGSGLLELARIECTRVHPGVTEAELLLACDVQSPLLGPAGAAAVYAPQKGATGEQVSELERALGQLAAVLARTFRVEVSELPGAGAAGGIGAGLHAVLGAKLLSGIDLVLDQLGFDARVRGKDLVLTAEGRFDQQTLRDKAPFGVARRARAALVPTVLLAGSVERSTPGEAFEHFAGVFPLTREPLTLEQALAGAAAALDAAAEQVARLFLAARPR